MKYCANGTLLGSTAAVTSNIGYLTRLFNYYPYGSLRLDEGSATTTFTQPNQFIGQDRDKEADLSYLNARYYSSNQGQFTSQDPVFWEVGQSRDGVAVMYNPQAQNSYSYAQGNPIVLKDPDGRCPVCGIIAIGALGGMALQGLEDIGAGNSFEWQNYAGAAAGGVGPTFQFDISEYRNFLGPVVLT